MKLAGLTQPMKGREAGGEAGNLLPHHQAGLCLVEFAQLEELEFGQQGQGESIFRGWLSGSLTRKSS